MELLREMLAQTCRFDLLEQYATDKGWEQRFNTIVESEQSSDITAYAQRMVARLNDRPHPEIGAAALSESPQRFLAMIRNTVENREFAKHAAADLLGLHYIIDAQHKKPNPSTIKAMATESDEETRARINKVLAGIDKAELGKFVASFGNHNYGQVRDMVIRAERRLQSVYDEFGIFKHLQQ